MQDSYRQPWQAALAQTAPGSDDGADPSISSPPHHPRTIPPPDVAVPQIIIAPTPSPYYASSTHGTVMSDPIPHTTPFYTPLPNSVPHITKLCVTPQHTFPCPISRSSTPQVCHTTMPRTPYQYPPMRYIISACDHLHGRWLIHGNQTSDHYA